LLPDKNGQEVCLALDANVARAASRTTAEYFLSYFGEWNLSFDSAALEGHLRHSIHDTAFLILTERTGAIVPHGKQAFGSVLAHSGQNDANGIFSRGLRRRVKQHIDGRAMAADPFLAANDANVVRPRTAKAEVGAPRRNIRMARQNALAIAGFSDLDGAYGIEALCEACGEIFRHMQSDKVAGASGGIV